MRRKQANRDKVRKIGWVKENIERVKTRKRMCVCICACVCIRNVRVSVCIRMIVRTYACIEDK